MDSSLTPPAQPRAGFVKRAWNVVKILTALALAAFVISKTDLRQIGQLLASLSPAWLALSFVLFCALTLLKALQYYLLTGRRVGYGRVLHVVIVQNAVTNFIAGGAGIASYFAMLSVDDGVRLRRTLSAFVIAKVGDLLAVAVVLLVTAALTWQQIGILRAAVVVVLLIILGAVGTFVAVVLLRRRALALAEGLLRLLRLDRLGIARRGLELIEMVASQDTASVVRALLTGIGISAAYMAVTLVWFYANIRAFSLPYSFLVVSFVNAFIQLISWIPIQVFGGLGVSETSLVYLFGVFGFPSSQVAALGVGLRMILYGFTLLVLSYLPLSALLRPRGRAISPR